MLKTQNLLLTSLIAVLFNTANAVDIPPPLSDPYDNGGWVINAEVSDEFNGNDFDRNVWWNQGENGQWNGQWKGRAPSQFNPDNVEVKDGHLYMTARWQPDYAYADEYQGGNPTGNFKYGEVAPVTTAALLGKNFFLYGYMEMRSKAAPGPISSSYWTTGNQGETDAFESFGYNPNNKWSAKRFHTSFHDWRVTDGVKSPTYGKRIWDNAHILDFNVADDFHTYGFEWDKDFVAIYIDGTLINCVTRSEMGDAWVATGAQRPWIDMEIFSWEVPAENLTANQFNGIDGIDFVIDYARVYQRTKTSTGKCHNRENLLKNPSFESAMNDWTISGSGTTSATSDSVHHANSAASLSGSVTIEQVVTVKPNTTYSLSAFTNATGTDPGAGIWRNGFLGVKSFGGTNTDVRYFKPEWHEKSLQFTTGANNTSATVYFSKTQNEVFLVDEMQLYEMAVPEADIPVTTVTLPQMSITLDENETYQLSATILPANATNKSLIWLSSDETIATVNEQGLVEAIKQGSVSITVTTTDNIFKDSMNIRVVEPVITSQNIEVASVSIPSTGALIVGSNIQLNATVLPTNASNSSLTWASSDPTIASVNSNGNVTGISEGVITIFVTTADGFITEASTVTVSKLEGVEASATSGGSIGAFSIVVLALLSFKRYGCTHDS